MLLPKVPLKKRIIVFVVLEIDFICDIEYTFVIVYFLRITEQYSFLQNCRFCLYVSF